MVERTQVLKVRHMVLEAVLGTKHISEFFQVTVVAYVILGFVSLSSNEFL
jgi:hypothetical protein